MKKTSAMCMMVLCLAAQDASARLIYAIESLLTETSEEAISRLREDFKDAAKVRKRFLDGFLNSPPQLMPEFKRKFGVGDEPMRTVLVDIIRESVEKVGWEWSRPDDTQEDLYTWKRMYDAIPWLGVCADAEAKQFLMQIAGDRQKGYDIRARAIEAYMRRANAQEVQDMATRLLADEARAADMKDGFAISVCVYGYAIRAYDEAEGDTQKREAIISSLSAALMREKNERFFAEVDQDLARRDKEYAESPQRKAALERMNPPTKKAEPLIAN